MRRIGLFISLLLLATQLWAQDLTTLTKDKNHTIPELLTTFSKLENYYTSHQDRRKLFVKVYALITNSIEQFGNAGKLENRAWMDELILGFGDEYRNAVWAYEKRSSDVRLPLPWKFDFDHALAKDLGLATQLLLSLNSHILHDLPITVANSVDEADELEFYKEDYFALNDMFKSLMPALFNFVYIESNYGMVNLSNPSEVLKRKLVFQMVLVMRKSAWKNSIRLAKLETEEEKAAFIKKLGEKTLKVSKLTVALDPVFSVKPSTLLSAEAIRKAWEIIGEIGSIVEE